MKQILLLMMLVATIGCEIEVESGHDSGKDFQPPNTQQPIDETSNLTYAPNQGVSPANDRLIEASKFEMMTGEPAPLIIHGKAIDQTWSGSVVKISDGDTITVLRDNEQIKVRLESIDTPERGQPFGTKAKNALAAMVHQKVVTIHETGKDRYGRSLGFIYYYLTDFAAPPLDVCEEMVKQGYAWEYTQYSKSETLGKLQQEAKDASRGLWAGTGPDDQVPPWEWRRR